VSRNFHDNISDHLQDFIGETVTIFTESGGQSGCGFTGVVLFVSQCLVRLITCIGPAPGCALGNGCNRRVSSGFGSCRDNHIATVGSVADIPIDKIVCFVHNAV